MVRQNISFFENEVTPSSCVSNKKERYGKREIRRRERERERERGALIAETPIILWPFTSVND